MLEPVQYNVWVLKLGSKGEFIPFSKTFEYTTEITDSKDITVDDLLTSLVDMYPFELDQNTILKVFKDVELRLYATLTEKIKDFHIGGTLNIEAVRLNGKY